MLCCRVHLPAAPLPTPLTSLLRPASRPRAAFSDVWLRDRLLMLCHLSVAPLMRGALSHLGSMQAALAGLRAIGRWADELCGLELEGITHLGLPLLPSCCCPVAQAARTAECPVRPPFLPRSEAEERGGMLADTRRQCQSEFTRSLRNHEWVQVGERAMEAVRWVIPQQPATGVHLCVLEQDRPSAAMQAGRHLACAAFPLPRPLQCWLLSPWRQQGAFVLAVSTAQLVAAVSAQRHNLLRYVPELYCTTVLDMVRLPLPLRYP